MSSADVHSASQNTLHLHTSPNSRVSLGNFLDKFSLDGTSSDDSQLDRTSMTIARGEQRVKAVTHVDDIVVYVVESTCAPEVLPSWGIYAVNDASHMQDVTNILSYSSVSLPCDASPECISLSKDGVLAVSLGGGGLKLYKLTLSVHKHLMHKHLLDAPMNNHCHHLMDKWVALSYEGHCLISRTMCKDDGSENLWVQSCMVGRRSVQHLLRFAAGTLLDVDAASPGHVIALRASYEANVLTRAMDGTFICRTVNLRTLCNAGPPMIAAIGDSMFVVSTAEHEGTGEVICVNIKTGMMSKRFSCKGQATCVVTEGSRCAFGTASGENRSLFCIHENDLATFTLSQAVSPMEWPKDSISLDCEGLTCGVTHEDPSRPESNISVIQYLEFA